MLSPKHRTDLAAVRCHQRAPFPSPSPPSVPVPATGHHRPSVPAYLGDLGVGAAAVAAAGVHPAALVGQAVLPQRAAPLQHAPAALEARVSLQAQATALPQGRALVQVGCNGRRSAGISMAPPAHGHRGFGRRAPALAPSRCMQATSSQGDKTPWAGGTSTLDSTLRQSFGLSPKAAWRKASCLETHLIAAARALLPLPRHRCKLWSGLGRGVGWGLQGALGCFPTRPPSLTHPGCSGGCR